MLSKSRDRRTGLELAVEGLGVTCCDMYYQVEGCVSRRGGVCRDPPGKRFSHSREYILFSVLPIINHNYSPVSSGILESRFARSLLTTPTSSVVADVEKNKAHNFLADVRAGADFFDC